MQKRILSMLLCMAMLFGIAATGVFAEDEGINTEQKSDNGGITLLSVEDSQTENSVAAARIGEETKISPIFTAPTAREGLLYSGAVQDLHNSGTVTGGTMQYSSNPDDENSWTTDIQKGTKAGKYDIYYRIIGDATHKDVAPTRIENVKISPLTLSYEVKYEDKMYDGTTAATFKSIKFYANFDPYDEVKLNEEDYVVESVEFESPDADYTARGKSVVTLTDTENAKNYAFDGDTTGSGARIWPAPVEGARNGAIYIRYDDTAMHEYGATIMGAPNDTDYVLYTDCFHIGGDDIVADDGKVISGTAKMRLKSGLTKDDVGKKYVFCLSVWSYPKRNYCSDKDYNHTLRLTLNVVDKYPVELSAEPLKIKYDGNPVPIEKVNAKALFECKTVDGTVEWKDGSPTNVSESGEYEIVFTPTDTENYLPAEGKVNITIEPIQNDEQNNITLTLNETDFTYDGEAKEPSVTVKNGDAELSPDTDYDIEYSGNTEVGTATVTVKGKGNYSFTLSENFEIKARPSRPTGGGGGGAKRFTVAFNTNGGNTVASLRVLRNSAVKEPTAPTKDGYDFGGWYTDKELKNKYDFSEKVTKSFTLYAAWVEKDDSANKIILVIGEKSARVFGETKTNDVAPKIVNDRTMLPARFVAENLGAKVEWNESDEIVTIRGKNLKTGEDVTIVINIGSDIAYVNEREFKLDSAAFIENDRTYTPIRFISEELGADVDWSEEEQKVIITIPETK